MIFRTLLSRSWRDHFFKFDLHLSWNSDSELGIHLLFSNNICLCDFKYKLESKIKFLKRFLWPYSNDNDIKSLQLASPKRTGWGSAHLVCCFCHCAQLQDTPVLLQPSDYNTGNDSFKADWPWRQLPDAKGKPKGNGPTKCKMHKNIKLLRYSFQIWQKLLSSHVPTACSHQQDPAGLWLPHPHGHYLWPTAA